MLSPIITNGDSNRCVIRGDLTLQALCSDKALAIDVIVKVPSEAGDAARGIPVERKSEGVRVCAELTVENGHVVAERTAL